MNRRGFLSLLAKGAAALAVAPLLPAAAEPVNLSVPMTWSEPSADKVAFIKAMLDKAIQAHDDEIERAIFASTGDTHDIRGLQGGFQGPYRSTEEARFGRDGDVSRFWRSDVGGARREG